MLDKMPWYRQFWPWFLIGLVSSAVLASIATLVIALSNPEQMVVNEAEYQEIKASFRPDPANQPRQDDPQEDENGSEHDDPS